MSSTLLAADRAGQLLELQRPLGQTRTIYLRKILHSVQEHRVEHEIEDGLGRARVAPLGLLHRRLDDLAILSRHGPGIGDVGAIDAQAGNHLAQGKGEAVEREVATTAVALGNAVQLVRPAR